MKILVTLYKANKVYVKELLRSGKLFIFVQVSVLVLAAPANYLLAYAPKNFLDSILYSNNLTMAMLWIGLFFAIQLYNRLIQFVVEILKKRAYGHAKIAAKRDVYSKLEYIYLTFFEDASNITAFDKALGYCDVGGETLTNLCITILNSIVCCGTLTVISFQFDWWVGCAILAIAVLQYFTDRYMKKKAFTFNMDQMKRVREQNYFNSLPTKKESIAEIKLNSSMNFFVENFVRKFFSNLKIQEDHDRKFYGLGILFSLPSEIFTFFCYLLIGVKLLNGEATIGDYTLFFSTIAGLNSQIRVIIVTSNMLYEQYLSAKVYSDFLDNESNFAPRSKISSSPCIQSIKFDNVSFCYPGQVKNAIDHMSISINKGERISIVGHNGAGKTTMVKLLSLLYMPTEGNIYLNGEMIQHDYKGYWNRMGVVFQNHQVFSMSVKDNVLLRDARNEDESRTWQVLNEVGLSDKIKSLDEQLDSPIGRAFYDHGIDLSIGEKQKISIARALEKDCDFYILDEPSSSLDPWAEDQLYQCISRIPKDKTVIIISHRLSCIPFTDRIIYIKDGRVIADGSHDELMQNCLEYRTMYQVQASKYINS